MSSAENRIHLHKTRNGQYILRYDCPKCGARCENDLGAAGAVATCHACLRLYKVPGEMQLIEQRDEQKRVERQQRTLSSLERQFSEMRRQKDLELRESQRYAERNSVRYTALRVIQVLLKVAACILGLSVISVVVMAGAVAFNPPTEAFANSEGSLSPSILVGIWAISYAFPATVVAILLWAVSEFTRLAVETRRDMSRLLERIGQLTEF